MSSEKFQIIENLRETHEIFNFLKLWETQSSFKIFKKTSGNFLNSLLKVFKDLKKTPGRLRLPRRFYDSKSGKQVYIRI